MEFNHRVYNNVTDSGIIPVHGGVISGQTEENLFALNIFFPLNSKNNSVESIHITFTPEEKQRLFTKGLSFTPSNIIPFSRRFSGNGRK